jgi:hypothetical protein
MPLVRRCLKAIDYGGKNTLFVDGKFVVSG